MSSMLHVTIIGAALFAAAAVCPICKQGVRTARAQQSAIDQGTDTATVRLHISKMTCGTCAPAARIALRKLPGVYSAVVTYEDSLGVVRYDPARVSPKQIAEHLTKLTGYGARILPDTAKARPPQTR